MYDFFYAISNVIGITGVAMILLAYFFISSGRWVSDSMPYQVLNFVGAWFMLFSLYFHWNLASVIIEIAWIMISIMGMYRALDYSFKKSCGTA
jgi:hypothetical protein